MSRYFTCVLGEELIPIPREAIGDTWTRPLCLSSLPQLESPHFRNRNIALTPAKGWDGQREMMKTELIKENLTVYHHMSAHLPTVGLLVSLRQSHLKQR